ncbi:MAG: hypothetical protein NTZ68_01850 [Candidatus Dependentiae bacterium]|nr:hypothetical protein [Candidatus Dependentiae bacterium]
MKNYIAFTTLLCISFFSQASEPASQGQVSNAQGIIQKAYSCYPCCQKDQNNITYCCPLFTDPLNLEDVRYKTCPPCCLYALCANNVYFCCNKNNVEAQKPTANTCCCSEFVCCFNLFYGSEK